MDCTAHGDSPGKNTEVGLPCPPPGDLPNPGIEPESSALIGGFLPTGLLGKSWVLCLDWKISILPNFLNDEYSISLYALNSVIYMAP